MKLSLMFFSGALAPTAGEQYRMALEMAKFADQEGFAAIWFPERHFTNFGSPYPNPLIMLSAVASCTERLRLRAGSLVAPLHNPLRLAEELAMLDQLSGGRVDMAFASGWHPNDYAFHPERYGRRRELLFESIDELSALWRGDVRPATSGTGEPITVKTYPRPVQRELPMWVAAAQNAQTFADAGRRGLGVLTHALDGNMGRLEQNIALYRASLAEAGHDASRGRVALMLHTFVGPNEAAVLDIVRRPYGNYLKSLVPLAYGLVNARARTVDLNKLSMTQVDQFVDLHFARSVRGASLIGTPDQAMETIERMRGIGVDEVACLIDFGVGGRLVIDHLNHLSSLVVRLRDRASEQNAANVPA